MHSLEEVQNFVATQLKATSAKGEVDPHQSLVATGILDSFSFLELVAMVEGRFGVRIDLSAYDFDQISTIEGLATAVLAAQ